MSSKVLFLGKSDKHIMKVTNTDRSVTSAPAFASNLEFIWIVNTPPGDVVTHARDYVLSVTKEFLELVENDLPLLQYHYTCEINIPGCEHLGPSRGSGMVGGIRIDGSLYSLSNGMGECHLDLIHLRPDGTGERVRKIDIRDRKRIQTDNIGVIKIFRRKKKLTWPEVLPPLIKFLKRLPDDEILIQVLWSRPSLMDLVRAHERGFGEDDWAIEELEKMGDKAKTELIKKLQDPRASKYYVSIATLLLTNFPSLESKKAVEQLMKQETNETTKNTYAILLKTLGQ